MKRHRKEKPDPMASDDWQHTAEQLANLLSELHEDFRYHLHGVMARVERDDATARFVVNLTSSQTTTDVRGGRVEDSARKQPELTPEGYCLVDENYEVLAPEGAEPSRMGRDFIDLFKERQEDANDVNVALRWHGAATDALATQRGEIPITLELVNANILNLPVVNAAHSPEESWEEIFRWLAEEMRQPIEEGENAVVMAGYSCLTVAENLLELKRRVHAIERSAQGVLMGGEGIPPQWAALME
jgi:hypothetical protein